MSIRYTVNGHTQLLQKLQKISANAPNELEHYVWDDLALFAEQAIKNRTPVRKGRLRASIGRGPEGIFRTGGRAGARIWAHVGTRVKYAAAVEYGTAPHSIQPRNAGALAFYWERVGHHVVLPYVSHPGNPAFAMFEGGIRETERAAGKLLDARLRRLGL